MRLLAAGAEHESNVEQFPVMGGYVRAGLWLSLLSLTVTLLLFPARPTLEYHPIQSIPAIVNLPLFAALYAVWLLFLLLLLVVDKEAPQWEKPALVGIFALVFVGFWLFTGPYAGLRYDGIQNAAHVRYLSQQADGKIPVDHVNLTYFAFPGTHLLAFVLVQVTSLDVTQGVTLALAFNLVLLAVLVYIFLLRTLGSPSLAALGTLLVIQGNIMLARYSFWAGMWALTFLAMFLILLSRPGRAFFETWQERFLMILLLVATTITHLVTAVLLFAVLAGINLVGCLHLRRAKAPIGLVKASTLAAFLIIPLSWDIYWATRFFDSFMQTTSGVIQDFTEKGFLVYFFNLGGSYVGGGVPLWAVIVRYFWWGALFFFGTILALGNILNIKGLSRARQIETGGLVAVIILSIAITLLSMGGAEYYRFLLYAAFFTIAIILRFLLSSPRTWRRFALGLAISLFFVLSFPTFLAHNNMVGVSTYYPSELEAGSLLRETSAGEGQGLTVFFDQGDVGVLSFSVPDARFVTTPQGAELRDKQEFWQAADSQVDSFKSLGTGTRESNAFFYLSQRRMAFAQLFFGAGPQEPEWEELQDSLVEANKLYENGIVQIYGSIGNAP